VTTEAAEAGDGGIAKLASSSPRVITPRRRAGHMFVATYTPSVAGRYRLTVSYDGEDVHQCPIRVTVTEGAHTPRGAVGDGRGVLTCRGGGSRDGSDQVRGGHRAGGHARRARWQIEQPHDPGQGPTRSATSSLYCRGVSRWVGIMSCRVAHTRRWIG
jgi:hypothetical protein